MYKICRSHDWRIFNLEVSHRIWMFSYISKYRDYIEIRYYLSIQQLKQIYYNLIYPYISYSILARGSVYKTHIKKIQIKQNHTVRLIFFFFFFGRETESAKPLLNLLDLLTIDNIYRLEVLQWNSRVHGIMAFSLKYLTTHFNMPEIFIDITPDIQLNRIFINMKLKLLQGSNQFLTWQLISGKTFHLL